MPYEVNALLWGSILHDSKLQGDLKLLERVAKSLIDPEPQSCLSYNYLVLLAKAYERRVRWESLVRVRGVMNEEVKSNG